MDAQAHARLDTSQPDRTTIWIDVAGRSVNVLFEQVFEQLCTALESVASGDESLPVVLRSAKANGFAVGADLRRIASLDSQADLEHFLLQGQRALGAVERSGLNTVAFIEGVCLGGGLELALACRYRFASFGPATQLGMPETKLGLMPGWGGTQRLIETIGLETGLDMLLSGQSVDARRALEIGLVDAIATSQDFEAEATRFLHSLPSRSHWPPGATETPSEEVRAKWLAWQKSHRGPVSPAQQAILKAVDAGIGHSRERGLQAERELFFPLLTSATAQAALERFRPGR